MKTLPRLLVLVMALCSIGADQKACTGAPVGLSKTTIYCYTDPPVGCAAYCQAVHTLGFTYACGGPAADALEQQFRDYVIAFLDEQDAQGVEVCPQDDLYKYVTPCDVGIIPVEWPGQDHAVCTPAPPGCPL
jgi:hypothetical protein